MLSRQFGEGHWFRVHQFCPAEFAPQANHQLNEVFGDSGDNLGVPMSTSGDNPPEYFACSGVHKLEHLIGIQRVVMENAGMEAFVVGESSHKLSELLTTFGPISNQLRGQKVDFWVCADFLGLSRIEPPDIFDKNENPVGLLLQAIVTPYGRDADGHYIRAISPPWLAILEEIKRNPNFLYEFSRHPRKFEEFIAGAYERAGWSEVILTPASGDKGRDVIASKTGYASVRILDQVKAYSPGRLVTHDDLRAMLGVLQAEPNASKGIVTTTSDFQPTVYSSREFRNFMPYRLELKNGEQLREWLISTERTD